MSRIGKLPVAIPAGVKVTVANNLITVEGPKGKLTQDFCDLVSIEVKENEAIVTRKNDTKPARSAHGLYRNLLNNMVTGVSNGFSKSLVINGVGYRAEVKGKELVMNLGYSSDYIAIIPEGLTVVATPDGKLTISGIDKQLVGEFAANVRKIRKPEPYKGKGIRYADEHIRRKEGKKASK